MKHSKGKTLVDKQPKLVSLMGHSLQRLSEQLLSGTPGEVKQILSDYLMINHSAIFLKQQRIY